MILSCLLVEEEISLSQLGNSREFFLMLLKHSNIPFQWKMILHCMISVLKRFIVL